MHFTLPGRVPSKKNSKRIVIAGGQPRLIPSEAFIAWHEEMMLRIRRYRPKKTIARSAVALRFFAENRRKFDLTNAAESVMDLLVDADFLADDCAENVPDLHLVFGGVEPKNARVEIAITELP